MLSALFECFHEEQQQLLCHKILRMRLYCIPSTDRLLVNGLQMDTNVSVESVSRAGPEERATIHLTQSDHELKQALCGEKLASVRSSKRKTARPHMPQEHGIKACSPKNIHSRMRNYSPPPRKIALLRMRMCKIQ